MSDKTAQSPDSPARKTGYYLLGQGYRAYNPVLMRFTSADSTSPFGRGGLNAYAYCLGDPVNLVDPDGHSPLTRIFDQLRKLFAGAATRLNKPKGMKRLVETSSPSLGRASISPSPSPPPVPPRKQVIETSHEANRPPPLPPRKPAINSPDRATFGNTPVPHAMKDASKQTLDETTEWLKFRSHRKLVHSNAVIVIGDPIVPAGQIRAGKNTRPPAIMRDRIRSTASVPTPD